MKDKTMPTDPYPGFHGAASLEEDEDLQELLEELASGLTELVNFGTHVFGWCYEETQKSMYGDEVVPLILQFRHLLEMTDAVQVLVARGVVHPAKLQLRSALEAVLGMRYIIEGSLEKRSHAFLVCHLHKKKKSYQRMDPSTQLGKQFASAFDDDELESLSIEEEIDLEAAKESVEEMLKSDRYKRAEEAYQSRPEKGSGAITWYELDDGPETIEQLAREVDMEGLYKVFYRHWSKYSHAENLMRSGLHRGDDHEYLAGLRIPTWASTVVTMSSTLSLRAYREMVNYLVPGKRDRLEQWYMEKFAQFHKGIASSEQLTKIAEGRP